MNFNKMVAKLDESVNRFSNLRRNSDEYRKSHHQQIELTQELYDFITGEDRSPDIEALEKIFLDAEADIPGWLLNLPFNLAACGMVDEAVEISRRYSGVFSTENFLGDLAAIYAEAGRKEEAFKQLAGNLNRFPEDVWIIIKAGHAFETLKENEKALELYERAYGMTKPRTYDREGTLERLVPLLREMDKDDEADELIRKEDELPQGEKVKLVPPVKTRKIGRNEQCPCGSAKKFKKCCGK